MKHSASEEVEGYQSARNDGDREYWLRQIIIRRLRIHRERNQAMLRNEHILLAKMTGAAIAGGGIGVLAMAKWLS